MNNFKEISLAKGEVLFEAGAPADKLYLIQSGAVGMADKSGRVFVTLKAGESFGEQALLAGGVRSAAAQAVGATACLEITAQGLRDLLAKEGGIATQVLEALLLQLYMHNAIKR